MQGEALAQCDQLSQEQLLHIVKIVFGVIAQTSHDLGFLTLAKGPNSYLFTGFTPVCPH